MNAYVIPGIERQKIKSDILLNAISTVTGIEIENLQTKCRKQELVEARYIYFYFITRSGLCQYISLARQAREFNLDHTTALHGVRQVENWIQTDKRIQSEVEQIKKLLNIK
jgi:chromosomal replication initiator protein